MRKGIAILTSLFIGLVLVVGFFLYVEAAHRSAVSGWVEAEPIPLSTAYYGTAQCAGDPDSFYIVGAYAGSDIASLRRFDVVSDTWDDSLEPMPVNRIGASMVCYDNKLYVAGGAIAFQSTFNHFFIYDISADDWITGTTLPRNVIGAALGAWDGYLYLIGGDDAPEAPLSPSTQVDRYNIETGVWEADWGTQMPTATLASWTQTGPYVYLVGGWLSGSAGLNSNTTFRYDMSSDSWSAGPEFEKRLAMMGLVATQRHLYAIGGDPHDDGTYWGVTSTVQSLNFTQWPSGTWLVEESLPIEVQGNTAGACTTSLTGGEIWSAGGVIDRLTVTSTVLYHETEPCYKYFTARTPILYKGMP